MNRSNRAAELTKSISAWRACPKGAETTESIPGAESSSNLPQTVRAPARQTVLELRRSRIRAKLKREPTW
jgi:hypothetical protein